MTESIPQDSLEKNTEKSKIGLTSFIISLTNPLFAIVLIILSLIPFLGCFTGPFILLVPVISLGGVILGIVAVFEKNKERGLAIAGLIINGLFLLAAVGLVVFGIITRSGTIESL